MLHWRCHMNHRYEAVDGQPPMPPRGGAIGCTRRVEPTAELRPCAGAHDTCIAQGACMSPDPIAGLRPPNVPERPVPVFAGDLLWLERAFAGRLFQQRRYAATPL